MTEPTKYKRRPVIHGAAFLVLLALVGAVLAVFHPQSPLPREWNPSKPLRISDPLTPLTMWKLTHALGSDDVCLAALDADATFDDLPDFEESAQCHIRPQVRLRTMGSTKVDPLNTRCQTALRLAMWEHHGIQPAATQHLDTSVREITHFSSYSCRQIRTLSSGAPRMSTHATASAIDVSGFVLADGRRLTLKKDWDGAANDAAFLRDARDSACTWFRVTLGPEYNALHADHFHLQHTGFGLCR